MAPSDTAMMSGKFFKESQLSILANKLACLQHAQHQFHGSIRFLHQITNGESSPGASWPLPAPCCDVAAQVFQDIG